jgi:ribosome biogenesis GTPase
MTTPLVSLGWDATFANAYAPRERADTVPGRVVRVDRGVCTALTRTGLTRASLGGSILAAAAKDQRALPCVGDWIVVRAWRDGRFTAEEILPRKTAVCRGTAGKSATAQILAANVDVAMVVEPMHPSPDLGRIERLLAVAFESGARPVVVLTKADSTVNPCAIAAQVAEAAPKVPVYAVSAQSGFGMTELGGLTKAGLTMVLLGPSGAGKSTLVNAIAGARVMTTQEIRRADGRGRHTTAFRQLIPLSGGGAIIDTPGLRGVGLFDSDRGLAGAFGDVEELADYCRFNDCSHASEPNCAVQAAVADGDLPPRRLESWRKLQREIDWESRRRDVRLAAEARLHWKRLHHQQRSRFS